MWGWIKKRFPAPLSPVYKKAARPLLYCELFSNFLSFPFLVGKRVLLSVNFGPDFQGRKAWRMKKEAEAALTKITIKFDGISFPGQSLFRGHVY